MILNQEIEIKYYYRFIEFTSKMLKSSLPHERYKLISLDYYKAESEEEMKVKTFSESYLYLLNNVQQSLTIRVIQKAYYLLTDILLKEAVCKKVLKAYYQNYDEAPHYLASLVHFTVLDNIKIRKIEFAFMLSNFIMLKKQRCPLIPYVTIHEVYNKVIQKNNIQKLMLIFQEIEVSHKLNAGIKEFSLDKIIQKVKELKPALKGKYDIKKLYLYGSYAKQRTTNKSDMDFLLIFRKELVPFEKSIKLQELKTFLNEQLQIQTDLLDFTHAMEKLDISEMENIITLI